MATRAKRVSRNKYLVGDYQEGLGEYLQNNPKWYTYFNRIKNHSDTSLREGDWLIYNAFSLDVKRVKEIRLSNNISGTCLDVQYKPRQTASGEKAISFVTGRNYCRTEVAVFLIEKQSLIMCDLTHSYNENAERIIKRIINYLRREKLLKTKRSLPKRDTTRREFSITLGADPEFEVRRHGEVVFASEVDYFNCEDYVTAAWGLDGSKETVEARPEIGRTPEEAVALMRDLFSNVVDHDLTVQGNRYSIGGHLHIGGIIYEPIDNVLIRLYDSQIGIPTQSMNGNRRKVSSYFGLGKIETKPYGFEYRTPPAGIFYHPRLLELCYKIMQTTATKWYSGERLVFSTDNRENLRIWSDFTPEEITEYYQLISDYRDKADQNVIEGWIDSEYVQKRREERLNRKYRVGLNTNDAMSMEYTNMIRAMVAGLYVKGSPKTVYFYGLRESRGDVVAGMELDGFETIDHPDSADSRLIRIAMPYKIRTQYSRQGLEPVIEQIRKHLVEVLGCV